ncbi:MAG: PqqD family protein [Candidatus Schekmanbacteria bacterium]|nr:PqqD family protein [Candidatus Schekmanbacteria bacterium]
MSVLTDTEVVIVRSERTVAATVDGEAVLLDIEKGAYFGLDAVGTRVWEMLALPRTLSDLCMALTEEYDVELGVCREQTSGLLQELVAQNLVELLPLAVAGTADSVGAPPPANSSERA